MAQTSSTERWCYILKVGIIFCVFIPTASEIVIAPPPLPEDPPSGIES